MNSISYNESDSGVAFGKKAAEQATRDGYEVAELFTATQMRQARIEALEEALAYAETEAAQGPNGHAYYAIKALIEQEQKK